MVKRRLSSVVVLVYWLLLACLLVAASGVTLALMTTGQVEAGPLPLWTILGLTYALPVLVGWRIWVITRARRIAALTENFGTDGDDV